MPSCRRLFSASAYGISPSCGCDWPTSSLDFVIDNPYVRKAGRSNLNFDQKADAINHLGERREWLRQENWCKYNHAKKLTVSSTTETVGKFMIHVLKNRLPERWN